MLKCTDVGEALHHPTAFIIPRPHGVGHYATMSVRLSVLCLTLSRERKGAASWKLAGGKPITRVTRDPIYSQKVKGHQVA